jgi:hypothetical protein
MLHNEGMRRTGRDLPGADIPQTTQAAPAASRMLLPVLLKTRIPTSRLFQDVLRHAPMDCVTPAWLLKSLHDRSFGMVMLLLGLIAMVPGISPLAGILLAALGFQMMMAREALALPRFIALRPLPTRRIAWLIDRSTPIIGSLEKVFRPRWQLPGVATKRVAGFVVTLLAVTLFTPFPFSNIIPGASTMLIALAYLEEDGAWLCIALAVSVVSFAISVAEVWITLQGAGFLLNL